MNFRLTFSWLLAVPMFLMLLLFAFCFLGSLVLLPMRHPQALFFLTGSFFYLLCAHLFYFGSYFTHPPLYQGALRFIRAFFHPMRFVVPLVIIYLVSIGYVLHHFHII